MNIDDIKDTGDIETFLVVMREVNITDLPRREVARLYDKMFRSGSGSTSKKELIILLESFEKDLYRTKAMADQINFR